jgi:hypothetical protein
LRRIHWLHFCSRDFWCCFEGILMK